MSVSTITELKDLLAQMEADFGQALEVRAVTRLHVIAEVVHQIAEVQVRRTAGGRWRRLGAFAPFKIAVALVSELRHALAARDTFDEPTAEMLLRIQNSDALGQFEIATTEEGDASGGGE